MEALVKRLSVAAVASTIALPAMAADVVIGVPNWPSVLATAHVIKVALEENLGLEVELQNGTNPVVFEAMAKRWTLAPCMYTPKSGYQTRPISTRPMSKRRAR